MTNDSNAEYFCFCSAVLFVFLDVNAKCSIYYDSWQESRASFLKATKKKWGEQRQKQETKFGWGFKEDTRRLQSSWLYLSDVKQQVRLSRWR